MRNLTLLQRNKEDTPATVPTDSATTVPTSNDNDPKWLPSLSQCKLLIPDVSGIICAFVCIALACCFGSNSLLGVLALVGSLGLGLAKSSPYWDPVAQWARKRAKKRWNQIWDGNVFALVLAFLLGMLCAWGLSSIPLGTTHASSGKSSAADTASKHHDDAIDTNVFASVRKAIEEADQTARNYIDTAPGIHNKTVVEHGGLITRMCYSLALLTTMAANPDVNVEMPQGIKSVSYDFCDQLTIVVSILRPFGVMLDNEVLRERLADRRTANILVEDFYSTHKEHSDVIRQHGILALKERLLADPAPAMYDTAVSNLLPADDTAKTTFTALVKATNIAWAVLSVALENDWWIRAAIVGGGLLVTSAGGGGAFAMRSVLAAWAKEPQFVAQLIGSLSGLSIPCYSLVSWVYDKWNDPRGAGPTKTTPALTTAFTNAALTLSTRFDNDYKSLLTLTDTLIGVQSALEGITESTTWEELKLKLKATTKDLSAALEKAGMSNDKLIDCATCVTPPNVQTALQYTTQVVDCGVSGNSTECQRPNNDTWLQTQTEALSKPFVTRNDVGDPDGVVPMVIFHDGLLNKFASILTKWQDFIDESLPKKAASELNALATENTPYVTLKPKLIKAIFAVSSIQQRLDTVIGKIEPPVVATMIFPQRTKDGNPDYGNLLKALEQKKTDGQAYTDGVIHHGMKIRSHGIPANIAKFTRRLNYTKVHTESRQVQGLSVPFFDQVREKTGTALYEGLKLFLDIAIAPE
jgi:hypothetical protein